MSSKISGVLAAILISSLSLSSCIKDEAANKECDILNAWVEGEENQEFFYSTSQMRKDQLGSNETEITFTVRSLIELPKKMSVYFDVTPGATIEPASGSLQDFTAGPVVYTVTSEDGEWKRQYKVQFKEADMPVREYNFENYERKRYAYSSIYYHIVYEKNADGTPNRIWASGNEGYVFSQFAKVIAGKPMEPEEFPTFISTNGYHGCCLKLTTLSTGDLGKGQNKPIAAGNLFLGHFNVDYVTSDPLKTTEMGVAFTQEPVRLRGYYKYQPGESFTGPDGNVIAGRTDEADVYGVLYRNVDENNKAVKLDGSNILTSPYVVRKARVEKLPATNEWTVFEMFFEGEGEIDQKALADQGYNLALVFTSSKEGAAFIGSIGSTLYIDELDLSVKEK